ncbi:proline-rich protein 36-like [Balaenoptera acutorostrata]|uniref:Proline-rich protein 36-like n=1 Tax=Balaenoptera acutorostrata TaxID=9767 RepID=A0ABM3SUG7_BALAC|nr:proline-rich protein 36-like [Balaenoptera acutorostrata]
MVGGLAGERRLHRDRARDAAGTRLPGPTRAPARGCGARGAGRGGATRGGASGNPALGPAGDQSTMSASEQASEPSSSSSSSRSPPLPPPLPPPPPPRPPVAAEGRGAQAARAAAVWARIREAPRSGGRGGDGSPHLHAISMRPALGPPPPAPPLARLICMHIPRRHIPGLNPAAPAARCAGRGAGPSQGRKGAAGQVGGKTEKECAARCFPLTPNISLRPNTWGFRVSGRERRLKRSLLSPLHRLPTSRETTRLSRGKGWGGSLRKTRSQQTEKAQRLPRAPSDPGAFRAVGKCEKQSQRSKARQWRVRGGVAPGASAGRPALRDLSLAAESEGGSRGPRAPRHACPGAPLRGGSSGQTRRSHCTPSPHNPPPRASSSSAARGPGALHPGAPRWTCTRPGASPFRPPAPREVPHPEPRRGPEGVGEPAGRKTRRPGGQAFLAPGCVRGGTWTFSPSTSIYLFSSYYALVGPEEGPDVGLRAGRCHEPQAWQGPDTQRLCPQPLGLGGSLPVSRLLSSQVYTTVPHSYSSGLLSSCF